MRISLSGPIGSGKTTLAQKLATKNGYRRVSFSTAITDELSSLLGMTVGEMLRSKEEWRWAIQAWGMIRRQAKPGYWLDVVEKSLCDVEHDDYIVVDDSRFPIELEMLRLNRFQLVKLDCPKEDSIDYQIQKGKSREEAEASADNITERALDDWQHWNTIISAPRSRPLDDIYKDLQPLLYP